MAAHTKPGAYVLVSSFFLAAIATCYVSRAHKQAGSAQYPETVAVMEHQASTMLLHSLAVVPALDDQTPVAVSMPTLFLPDCEQFNERVDAQRTWCNKQPWDLRTAVGSTAGCEALPPLMATRED